MEETEKIPINLFATGKYPMWQQYLTKSDLAWEIRNAARIKMKPFVNYEGDTLPGNEDAVKRIRAEAEAEVDKIPHDRKELTVVSYDDIIPGNQFLFSSLTLTVAEVLETRPAKGSPQELDGNLPLFYRLRVTTGEPQDEEK